MCCIYVAWMFTGRNKTCSGDKSAYLYSSYINFFCISIQMSIYDWIKLCSTENNQRWFMHGIVVAMTPHAHFPNEDKQQQKQSSTPTLIRLQPSPPWTNKYINNKMWNPITYPFPIFNGAAVARWTCVSYLIIWRCDNLSMLRLKLIHVSKMGP